MSDCLLGMRNTPTRGVEVCVSGLSSLRESQDVVVVPVTSFQVPSERIKGVRAGGTPPSLSVLGRGVALRHSRPKSFKLLVLFLAGPVVSIEDRNDLAVAVRVPAIHQSV